MGKLRDLDKFDDVLDEHFSNDGHIKTGLNNYYKAQDPVYREKISKANKGRILTEEHKEKISKSSIGLIRKPHSSETKAKIGKAHRNKIISDETREKMSISAKARDKSKMKKINGRKVSTPAGIFDTRYEAAAYYNVSNETMGAWCKRDNKPDFYFLDTQNG